MNALGRIAGHLEEGIIVDTVRAHKITVAHSGSENLGDEFVPYIGYANRMFRSGHLARKAGEASEANISVFLVFL